METIEIDNDITTVYVTAASFPEGIMGAHEQLHAVVPFSHSRHYFGISWPIDGHIVYKAAAEVASADEAETFGLQTFTIKKGSFTYITIHDYMKDISLINKAFEQLLQSSEKNPEGYCLEWYLGEKDVRCMVPMMAG